MTQGCIDDEATITKLAIMYEPLNEFLTALTKYKTSWTAKELLALRIMIDDFYNETMDIIER
jgi:hypothetical protein